MISHTLSQIRNKRFPSPFFSTVFLPHIKCALRSRYPREIIQRRTAAKGLAAGIRLLNTFIVVAFDHSCFIGPVVFAASDVHCESWGTDLFVVFGGPDA